MLVKNEINCSMIPLDIQCPCIFFHLYIFLGCSPFFSPTFCLTVMAATPLSIIFIFQAGKKNGKKAFSVPIFVLIKGCF